MIRKNKSIQSSYSYECKTCTIARVKNQKRRLVTGGIPRLVVHARFPDENGVFNKIILEKYPEIGEFKMPLNLASPVNRS
ncbi:MAG: hypothetical protein CM15mP113_1680 [Pseudomonadota bacterium]|nr:MAG: hypothetical protein CM15mP113_1680 [Pseudomonadota bacterium]